jgi:hypothetical protein
MPTLILKSVDGSALRIRVKEVPQSILTGATAVSGAQNLSSEGLFVQNNNGILEFKGLQAGNGITLTPSATGITINANVTGVTGYVTEATFTGYTASTASVLSGLDNDINYVSGQTDLKLSQSNFNSYTGSTETRLQGIEDDITYLSGQTASKVSTSHFNSYTGATQTELNNINNELDLTITGGTGSNGVVVSKSGRNLNISYTGSTGGGAGVTLEYKYDSTVGGAPASKFFRLNNASASGATEISFSDTTNNSVDASSVLLAIKAGAKLYVQQLADSDEAVLYNVTADPVDNGTYVTFTVTLQSSGVDASFTNNQAFGIVIMPTGSYVSLSAFNTYTGSTETRLQGIENDIVYVSGVTDNKLNTSVFNSYTGATATVLSGIDDDITYLSGQTDNKLNISTFNSYTGATDTRLDGIEDDITYLSGQTASKVSTSLFNSYTGSTDTRISDIENDIVYISGITDNKLNTSVFNSYTGSTDPILDGAITGITVGTNLSVSQTGRVVDIQFTGSTGGGSLTGATNLGTGEGLFAQVNGANLEFKSLVAGSNITITPSSTGVTIASTGGGGGSSYASGITYQSGNTTLTGNTVQLAIEELDNVKYLDIYFTTTAQTFTYRSPLDFRIVDITTQTGTLTLEVSATPVGIGDTINQYDDLDVTTTAITLATIKLLRI